MNTLGIVWQGKSPPVFLATFRGNVLAIVGEEKLLQNCNNINPHIVG